MPPAHSHPGACGGPCAPDRALHRQHAMIPRATYRLQLQQGLRLRAGGASARRTCRRSASATPICRPTLKARPGSTHGYDIVDHRQLNPELGDEAAFRQHVRGSEGTLRCGQILDFVPNHMGVGGADNPLWLDVLEWGAGCRRMPAGSTSTGTRSDATCTTKSWCRCWAINTASSSSAACCELQFDASEGSFAVWAYGTHKLPISPPHYARILGDGQLQLEQLADAFAWLPNWRQQMPQRAAELKAQLATLVRRACRGARGTAARAGALSKAAPGDGAQLARTRRTDPAAALARGALSRGRRRHQLPALLQHQRSGRTAHGAAGSVRSRASARAATGQGRHASTACASIISTACSIPRRYLQRLQRRLDRAPLGSALLSRGREDPGAARDAARGLADRRHHRLRLSEPGAGAADRSAAPKRAFTDCYAAVHRRAALVRRDRALCPSCTSWKTRWPSELNVLARDMARLARQNPRTADFTRNLLRRAIKELIACFPGLSHLHRQQRRAGRRRSARPELGVGAGAAQRDRNRPERVQLSRAGAERQRWCAQPRSGFSRQSLLRCAMRLQQYSGPVDGQGRRGHGVLPLQPFHRAERGRRRSRALRRHRRAPSTRPTSSARSAGRMRC